MSFKELIVNFTGFYFLHYKTVVTDIPKSFEIITPAVIPKINTNKYEIKLGKQKIVPTMYVFSENLQKYIVHKTIFET
jgi:hypothetical protein